MSTPQRQYPRFAHEVAVVFRHAGKSTEGRTRNVSRGGLCANVVDAIALGTDVQVDVILVFDDEAHSEALTLPARVAWCTTVDDAFQIGLSFKPLNAELAKLLSLFLKYLGEERAPTAPREQKSIDDLFR